MIRLKLAKKRNELRQSSQNLGVYSFSAFVFMSRFGKAQIYIFETGVKEASVNYIGNII